MYFNMYIVCLAYIYIYIKSYVLNCRNHRSSLFSASSISYVSNYRDPTAFDEIFFDFRIISAILTNTSIIIIQLINIIYADPGGHTVWEVGLRAAGLLMWVRIPPGTWISVWCECCLLLRRGLCDGLITRPEDSYRRWCVVACDLETSWMWRPWPTGGCCTKNEQRNTNTP